MTPAWGEEDSQQKEFKDDLFPLNFYALPSKTPALVPKEGGQGAKASSM